MKIEAVIVVLICIYCLTLIQSSLFKEDASFALNLLQFLLQIWLKMSRKLIQDNLPQILNSYEKLRDGADLLIQNYISSQ